MSRKRHKTEEIIQKLRKVAVLLPQHPNVSEAELDKAILREASSGHFGARRSGDSRLFI